MTERNETPTEQMVGKCPIVPCDGTNPVHRFTDAESYLTALLNDTERRTDGGTMYILSVDTIYHLRATLRSTVATLQEEIADRADAERANMDLLDKYMAQITTLTEQLREARERRGVFEDEFLRMRDAYDRVIRERDAALAEAARLSEQLQKLQGLDACIGVEGHDHSEFVDGCRRALSDPPKGE